MADAAEMNDLIQTLVNIYHSPVSDLIEDCANTLDMVTNHKAVKSEMAYSLILREMGIIN